MSEFLGTHVMDRPGEGPLFDAVVELFCRVWADPPFDRSGAPIQPPDPAEIAARLKQHPGYPGFRGLVAGLPKHPIG